MSRKNKILKIVTPITLAVLIVISVILTFVTKNWRTVINSTDSNLPSLSAVLDSDAQKSKLFVDFIDVGQGDCTLIKYGKYNILIDCAKSQSENRVLDFLNAVNVTKLDLAIETHPDSDHIGGFSYVLSNVKCDLFLMPMLPKRFERTDTELTLISTLKTQKIKTEYAVDNKEYRFGDLKLVTYISLNEHEDKNDYSIVSKLTFKNASYLFMGDAGEEVEDELIKRGVDLSADILKAGHHGSNKSTSEAFIMAVKPSVAVFSCGLNNEYGHPSKDVLKTANNYNIKIFRTDTEGTIAIGTDGEKYYSATEKG